MKIYFLLMLISVFVGLSYMPMRKEAKQKVVVQLTNCAILSL